MKKPRATIEADVSALIVLIRFCDRRSRSRISGGRLPKSPRTFGVHSVEGKKIAQLFLTPGYGARASESIKAQGRILRALATGHRGDWPKAADPTSQMVHDAAWNLYDAALYATNFHATDRGEVQQQRVIRRVFGHAYRAFTAIGANEDNGRYGWEAVVILVALLALVILAAIGSSAFVCTLYYRAWVQTERRLVRTLLSGSQPWMTGNQLIDASDGALGPGLYHTLRTMEREGVLRTRVDYMKTENRNGKPRIYYTLAERLEQAT